ESGKLVLDDAEFDLGRELEGLVDMFSVQCINHNVETVLDLADDMLKQRAIILLWKFGSTAFLATIHKKAMDVSSTSKYRKGLQEESGNPSR
ncbi:hypothetical protein RYX36_029735, partial [Vicia faba]